MYTCKTNLQLKVVLSLANLGLSNCPYRPRRTRIMKILTISTCQISILLQICAKAREVQGKISATWLLSSRCRASRITEIQIKKVSNRLSRATSQICSRITSSCPLVRHLPISTFQKELIPREMDLEELMSHQMVLRMPWFKKRRPWTNFKFTILWLSNHILRIHRVNIPSQQGLKWMRALEIIPWWYRRIQVHLKSQRPHQSQMVLVHLINSKLSTMITTALQIYISKLREMLQF